MSAATYWIDRPYDYLVPEEFGDRVQPGMRVSVPFSRGNRQTEGVVLAMADGSKYETLKPILAVLDDKPSSSSGLRCSCGSAFSARSMTL